MLMEIPTTNELSDNTVALWEPKETPKAGDRVEFSYKQHWTKAEDPSMAGGRVVATRTGQHDWQPEQRTNAVDFAGGALEKPEEKPIEALVQAVGPNSEKIKIQGVAVQKIPEGRWRVGFQVAPVAEGGKLAEVGQVELRCSLRRGESFLTETWVYRINP